MRRHIYVSSRPEPVQPPRERISWVPSVLAVAAIALCGLALALVWPRSVSGSIDVNMRAGFVTTLHSAQPCAASMEFAHPEDELCAIWLDDQSASSWARCGHGHDLGRTPATTLPRGAGASCHGPGRGRPTWPTSAVSGASLTPAPSADDPAHHPHHRGADRIRCAHRHPGFHPLPLRRRSQWNPTSTLPTQTPPAAALTDDYACCPWWDNRLVVVFAPESSGSNHFLRRKEVRSWPNVPIQGPRPPSTRAACVQPRTTIKASSHRSPRSADGSSPKAARCMIREPKRHEGIQLPQLSPTFHMGSSTPPAPLVQIGARNLLSPSATNHRQIQEK